MALLNRLGTLVYEAGGLPILVNLMELGTVDRQLIASVMRTSGVNGEELLLKLLKFHKSEKVRMAAASVLSFRLLVDETNLPLEMLLDSSDSLVQAQSQF